MADSIRVLMISKACLVGAYQRKLEEIANYPDIELTVVVPSSWKDARGMLRAERVYTSGYELIDTPIHFNGNFHLHYYPSLKSIVDRVQPDVFHIDEEPYNFATCQALRLAKRVGAKSLFFSWQNILRRYPPPFSWLERWVLAHSDYGIVGNQEALKVWQQKGFTGPMTVIPQFGVDPELFTPNQQDRPERPFTIGYAGRLVEEKGLHILIKAALGLGEPWQIQLAGDGPYKTDLATLAGILNAGGQVKFAGGISSTEMPDFYRSLDVVVLPSLTRPNWKEQFGRLLIEAMACGIPVIGSNSGAIPEVIGNAGLIVPEGDEDALRGAIKSLIHDSDLYHALATSGRERVLNHFTQENVADQTVRVYRELMTE